MFKKAVKVCDSSGHEFIVGWYGQLKPGWSLLLDIPMFIPVEESMSSVFQFPLPKAFNDGYTPIVLNIGYVHLAPLVVADEYLSDL